MPSHGISMVDEVSIEHPLGPAGSGTAEMGPHSAKDMAQLDHAASSLGISPPVLGRHAVSSARGGHFMMPLTDLAACQSPYALPLQAVLCSTLSYLKEDLARSRSRL